MAASLDAVDFEPHVTLFCGPGVDTEARAVAEFIANRFTPIELTPNRLDHTEQYTKTLFLQFEESAVARQMFEVAANGWSAPSGYVLNPHLSLLYKKLPEAKRRRLSKTLDLPTGKYIFDRIRVVETELPIEDSGPIQRWRVVSDVALRPL